MEIYKNKSKKKEAKIMIFLVEPNYASKNSNSTECYFFNEGPSCGCDVGFCSATDMP